MKCAKRHSTRSTDGIKVVRLPDGRWGVRLRDQDGRPIKMLPKLGRIYGVLDEQGRDAPAFQASLRAVSSALARAGRSNGRDVSPAMSKLDLVTVSRKSVDVME